MATYTDGLVRAYTITPEHIIVEEQWMPDYKQDASDKGSSDHYDKNFIFRG